MANQKTKEEQERERADNDRLAIWSTGGEICHRNGRPNVSAEFPNGIRRKKTKSV